MKRTKVVKEPTDEKMGENDERFRGVNFQKIRYDGKRKSGEENYNSDRELPECCVCDDGGELVECSKCNKVCLRHVSSFFSFFF